MKLAITIAAGTSQGGGMKWAATHHSATVIAEAHVPGPGYIWPTPKNVASSQEPRDFEFLANAACIQPRIRDCRGCCHGTWLAGTKRRHKLRSAVQMSRAMILNLEAECAPSVETWHSKIWAASLPTRSLIDIFPLHAQH